MNTDRHKYRVWDKKDKEYLDPDYYEGFYMSPDGVVHAGITEWNGICDEYQEIPPKQMVVEHCTAITDAKDRLIFEHDRVKTVTGAIGVVEWLNGGFWVVFPDGKWCAVCGTQEIIGNIHEMEQG